MVANQHACWSSGFVTRIRSGAALAQGKNSVNHRSSGDSYDVIIVGSGPAGASAALDLAAAGVRVAILEREFPPRYKTCGGGVVHRAFGLAPPGVRDAVVRDCFTSEMNLLDAGLRFETRSQVPIVSMTMREHFDFLLLSAAKEAGAHFRPGCEVTDVFQGDERVELQTSTGSLRAPFVIAADGVAATVARKLRLPDGRRLIPALECEVFVGGGVFERFANSARFDFGVVPYGYGWVFPKKEHLSVGVLTMCRGGAKLNERFGAYLRRLGIVPLRDPERHGALIPVAPRRAPFTAGRVLLVGDAAGFADPLTGEGITFALLSGRAAARALVDGNLRAEAVGRAYDGEIAAKILPELRVARVLATMLYGHPALRKLLFRLYGHRFSDAMADILTGNGTYRSAVRRPANYLKLLKMRGRRPG